MVNFIERILKKVKRTVQINGISPATHAFG